LGLTALTSSTLRAAPLKDQIQVLPVWYGFSNWVLRYDTAVVLDIHIKVCTRNHAISEL
jgi:hypothetical protein